MSYARVGQGPTPVEESPRDVLGAVIAEFGPPDAVQIDNALAAGTVRLGATELAQIFRILLSNAIRFAPARPATIRVEGEIRGGAWEIVVIDEGPGIAEDHREAVFRPLVKLVSRDRDEGAGMGLAVLAKIVGRTGGRAWIETGPGGQGNAVRLRLGP